MDVKSGSSAKKISSHVHADVRSKHSIQQPAAANH